jgi:hypothetical protein
VNVKLVEKSLNSHEGSVIVTKVTSHRRALGIARRVKIMKPRIKSLQLLEDDASRIAVPLWSVIFEETTLEMAAAIELVKLEAAAIAGVVAAAEVMVEELSAANTASVAVQYYLILREI